LRQKPAEEPSTPAGLGMWIWRLRYCEGGDIKKIIAKAKQSGIKRILPKSGDSDPSGQITADLVRQFHDAGLKVYTWHYSVPSTIDRQIVHIEKMFELAVDGAIVDAELEWEADRITTAASVGADVEMIIPPDRPPGRHLEPMASAPLGAVTYRSKDYRPQALDFMTRLRKRVGWDKWIGLSTWPYPKSHPLYPFAEFGAATNAQLPQTYWSMHSTAKRAVDMLDESERQWGALPAGAVKLRVPTGSVFHGTPSNGVTNGQMITAKDVAAFLDRCESQGLPFYCLYSWDACAPEVWPVLFERAR
jgi:hypothetical protein